MKKTYWVLSVDGKLQMRADSEDCPAMYHTSDPIAVGPRFTEKFANADAVFIPVEVELPEADALARRHLTEKNAIIGALRDRAPVSIACVEKEVIEYLETQRLVDACWVYQDSLTNSLCRDPGLIARALDNLYKQKKVEKHYFGVAAVYRAATGKKKAVIKTANPMSFAETRVLDYLSDRVNQRFTSATIADALQLEQGFVVAALCRLVRVIEQLRGEWVPNSSTMQYWYEESKPLASKFEPPDSLVAKIATYLRGIHLAVPEAYTEASVIAEAISEKNYEVTCALDKLVARGIVWRKFDPCTATYQYRNEGERQVFGVDPPEKIVLDYLQKTRGEDSSALWYSVAAISRETKLSLATVQDIVERQNSTGAVMRQKHIDGYLYRAAAKPFALTPTPNRKSIDYQDVLDALKGNKYQTIAAISRDAGCSIATADEILRIAEKEGKAKAKTPSKVDWKRPLAKKPCRVKADSWREAIIQTLDAQKHPVTEAELEKLVAKRYPDKCGGKSVHGAVGSEVHNLKYARKHKRFRFEKRSGKVVMWTVKPLKTLKLKTHFEVKPGK